MSDFIVPARAGSLDPVEVRLIVGYKDWIGQPAKEVWFETFQMHPNEARDVQNMVEELVRNNPVDGAPAPRTLDIRTGYTSWGADSAPFLQVALFLSAAAATHTMAIGIDRLFAHLRSRRHTPDYWHEPLTREHAIDTAKWSVVASYGRAGDTFGPMPRTEDELEAIGDAHDVEASTWTIVLRDAYHATYHVTIGQIEGIATVSRIERAA